MLCLWRCGSRGCISLVLYTGASYTREITVYVSVKTNPLIQNKIPIYNITGSVPAGIKYCYLSFKILEMVVKYKQPPPPPPPPCSRQWFSHVPSLLPSFYLEKPRNPKKMQYFNLGEIVIFHISFDLYMPFSESGLAINPPFCTIARCPRTLSKIVICVVAKTFRLT